MPFFPPNGGGSGGGVQSITGDFVDNTDPANPVIDATLAITSGMLVNGSVTSAKLVPWTTNTVSGGAVQNLASSLVMAGTEQDYEFEGIINGANDTLVFSLQPNNLATDQESRYTGVGGGGIFSGSSATIYIADATAAQTIRFAGRISQLPGLPRLFFLHVYGDQSGTYKNDITGWWDVGTEITSIRLHASAAGGLLDGTTFRIRPSP